MISSAQPGAFPSQLFQHIVNDSQVGVVILEAVRNGQGEFQDFVFSYINPAGAAVLGYPADALVGQPYRSSFSQTINSDLLTAYRQVLETGEALRLPEVHYVANEAKRWFDLGITRYGDAVTVTFTDISTTRQVGDPDRQTGSWMAFST